VGVRQTGYSADSISAVRQRGKVVDAVHDRYLAGLYEGAGGLRIDPAGIADDPLCGPTPSFTAQFTAQYALDADIDWTPRDGV
jgi:hypothetical protein